MVARAGGSGGIAGCRRRVDHPLRSRAHWARAHGRSRGAGRAHGGPGNAVSINRYLAFGTTGGGTSIPPTCGRTATCGRSFYEMPWARSGKGTAWDGLSKFDLSKFNPWYFERSREFGPLCDRNGFVLYHNIYNTHNVLEIPPHWMDYPWRPANNIKRSGLTGAAAYKAGQSNARRK